MQMKSREWVNYVPSQAQTWWSVCLNVVSERFEHHVTASHNNSGEYYPTSVCVSLRKESNQREWTLILASSVLADGLNMWYGCMYA